MHWELSEEQDLYTQSLREWLAATASSESIRSWLDAGDRRGFDESLVADGWAGVGFDESIGGQGGGLLELALTARELGRTAVPTGRWLARAVAAPALTVAPDLARAAAGGSVTALAVRGDRIPAATPAVTSAGGRLTGTVPSVLSAETADRFVVPVAEFGEPPVLFLVDRADTGVSVRPRSLLDRSRDAGDLILDEARAQPMAGGREAHTALADIRTWAAVLVAADALGAAERMLTMTVDYAKQRKQFGRPIAAFQAVKHAAAQMLVTVESSYSVALYAAASTAERHPDAPLHAAAAKSQVTETCAALAESALTVHGAIGYTWEYDLQLFYKRANLDRALFGAPAAWNECIAAALPLLAVGS